MDSSGDDFSSWVPSLVQQWIHVLRQYSGGFGRIHTFSTWWQTRFLKRCFSIQFEWRSVPSRCLSCCLALRGVELHDDGWFFRRSVRHFFGFLFGVEALPINDCGDVDILTLIASSEQHNKTTTKQRNATRRDATRRDTTRHDTT